MDVVDVAVIGGGIAGASLAAAVAPGRRVLLLEREIQPGYHSSGRSAALFSETYGNATVRALSTGSRGFFRAPPTDFADFTLTRPRGTLHVGVEGQDAALDRQAGILGRLAPSVRRVDAAEAAARMPVLQPHRIAGAVFEPESLDLDTNGMLQGSLRGLRRQGGLVRTGAEVTALRPLPGGGWRVETAAGPVEAGIVVNAAGAWADAVAALAGIAPVGLVPKRRTAFLFDAPGHAIDDWPAMVDLDERFYFKPDAGKLLGSPADETPSPPCDAQPEEIDIAIAVDRIEGATTLQIRRLSHRWAGLRSFVADKTPVLGFDPAAPGFFWCAGQGGYGFQTAPAMARLGAALLNGDTVPDDLAALGVTAAALAPGRFAADTTQMEARK
ncbi:D-arginine dehydrogenase [Inquilinus ginsengisoli]|uniref:D-arginine dehydrogenase n=1 Tax=Inquilinus ginsengisoli TaxID=363840 RepID=A0ABU1JZY7_9PROT|nr:FAD-binding oxidoreductase [Inquilinus ginsengisoli]MDR6294186.1 D-arginine dehydrogenase [Inquilinus ginsengisoli]